MVRRFTINTIIISACFAGLFAYGQVDTAYVTTIHLDTRANERYWNWHLEDNEPHDLDNRQLDLADSILNVCIRENNNGGNSQGIMGIYIGPFTFFRQFVGSINKNNEIIVWVNCFCRTESDVNWRKYMMIVRDGGNCYFNVSINLTKKTYYKLYVNGF